jgi:hypothetical protein
VVASVEELAAASLGFGIRVAFWAARAGPQAAPPDLRATLATVGEDGAFVGALAPLAATARMAPPEVAAERVAAIRAGVTAVAPVDPVAASLSALARARPELGPRGPARDPYGYWPGAPWPEFQTR